MLMESDAEVRMPKMVLATEEFRAETTRPMTNKTGKMAVKEDEVEGRLLVVTGGEAEAGATGTKV